MNGIPASIVIRQLMATPTISSPRRPARPARLDNDDSTARAVARVVVRPFVGLALVVGLAVALPAHGSADGSSDKAPGAYSCHLKTADLHNSKCR